MKGPKPSMFIGSSTEGKKIAESIQLAVEYEVHSTIWHQGVFGLSDGTLESLVAALDEYDFATLSSQPTISPRSGTARERVRETT